MANSLSFEAETDRLDGMLDAMRQAMTEPADALARVADRLEIDPERVFASDSVKFQALVAQRNEAEIALARLIASLASGTEVCAEQFDRREMPDRMEKVIGFFSKLRMRQATEKRWRKLGLAEQVAAYLGQSDLLFGLVREQRAFLVAMRRAVESDLVQVISHRKQMIAGLEAENNEAVAAQSAVEDFIDFFHVFFNMLNDQIAAMNAMLNKLTIDSERRILLLDAFEGAMRVGRIDGAAIYRMPAAPCSRLLAGPAEQPHLAPLYDLFDKDILSLNETERRRGAVDEAFFARFDELLDKRDAAHYLKA